MLRLACGCLGCRLYGGRGCCLLVGSGCCQLPRGAVVGAASLLGLAVVWSAVRWLSAVGVGGCVSCLGCAVGAAAWLLVASGLLPVGGGAVARSAGVVCLLVAVLLVVRVCLVVLLLLGCGSLWCFSGWVLCLGCMVVGCGSAAVWWLCCCLASVLPCLCCVLGAAVVVVLGVWLSFGCLVTTRKGKQKKSTVKKDIS